MESNSDVTQEMDGTALVKYTRGNSKIITNQETKYIPIPYCLLLVFLDRRLECISTRSAGLMLQKETPPSCVSDTNLFVVGVQPRSSVNCNLPVVSRIHRNV